MLVTGVDIIEIDRVERVARRYGDRFLNRVYRRGEQLYARGRAPQLASRFAAKEAVMKLLGTGTRGVRWRDIEVVSQPGRAPRVALHDTARVRAERIGLSDLALSLSHSRRYAVASVVGSSREGNLAAPQRRRRAAPPPARTRDQETEKSGAKRMGMDDIKRGLRYELEDVVELDQTINRMGREGAETLSTPSLLALMEWASIHSTDHLLPDGRTTVGYGVDGMRHIAPTPIGATVVVTATLTEVDGPKLTYEIEAREGETLIGKATHKRAIVPTD